MRKKVRNTLRQFQMVPKGARLVIGLSGGADSVALLHVLHSLQKEFAWDSLTAVHIHHGLRGAAADEDARFAESFCVGLARKKRGGFCAMPPFGRRQARMASLPWRITEGIRRKPF